MNIRHSKAKICLLIYRVFIYLTYENQSFHSLTTLEHHSDVQKGVITEAVSRGVL